MTNKYLFSICIPTYNRKSYLIKTLEKLINLINLSNHQIEICVSDNNSNDMTYQALIGYQNKWNFIKINRNFTNLGFDHNLLSAINLSTSQYVWFLSDDDIILDNTINNIVLILTNNDIPLPSLIFLKPYFARNEKIEQYLNYFNKNPIPYNLIDDPNYALKTINWHISFLSSFILRKELIINKIIKYEGLGFIHTEMILNCLLMKNIVVSKDYQIISRQGNSSSYNIYKYFGTNFSKILKSYSKNFNKTSLMFTINQWLKIVVRSSVISNKIYRINKYNYFDLIIPYWNNVYFLLKVLPLILVPRFIVIYKYGNLLK